MSIVSIPPSGSGSLVDCVWLAYICRSKLQEWQQWSRTQKAAGHIGNAPNCPWSASLPAICECTQQQLGHRSCCLLSHPGHYSLHDPLPSCLRALVRMVTNSSAAVGCIPTVLSNCFLQAPHFMAMAMPCMISAASEPTLRSTTYGVLWLGRC